MVIWLSGVGPMHEFLFGYPAGHHFGDAGGDAFMGLIWVRLDLLGTGVPPWGLYGSSGPGRN
jgi:hypothetical protein